MAKGRITRPRPIESAILKHGWKNFEFRDLMTNVPREQLNALEIFFIRHFDSNNPKCGYNANSGGDAPTEISPRTVQKIVAKLRKPAVWKHPVHGIFVGSAAELLKTFPDAVKVGHARLSKIRRGLLKHAGGWTCPEVPGSVLPSYLSDVPRLWVNDQLGVRFFGSARELSKSRYSVWQNPEQLVTILTGKTTSVYSKGWRLATEEEARGAAAA